VQFFYPKVLKGITGTTLTSTNCDNPYLPLGQLGYLKNISRRGKYIVFDFSSPAVFILHLGMTGSFITESVLGKGKFSNYLSLRISFYSQQIVKSYYLSDKRKFARCYIACGEENVAKLKAHVFKSIGPDIIEIYRTEFVSRYLALANKRPTTLLKKSLLDQSIVSGLGNIYACETLHRLSYFPEITLQDAIWQSPVLPPYPSEFSPDYLKTLALSEIHRQALASVKDGIEHHGSSVQDYFDLYGNPGHHQDHLRVYGRKGLPCLRKTHVASDAFTGTRTCPGTIQRIEVDSRGTFFCPECQTIAHPAPPRPPLITPGPTTILDVASAVRKESK